MRKLTPAEMVTALRTCYRMDSSYCDECPLKDGPCDGLILDAADMIEELAGLLPDVKPEPDGKITYKVKIDTSAVDALEDKVDRINEKLKEAISLAGEIASMSGTCSITLE